MAYLNPHRIADAMAPAINKMIEEVAEKVASDAAAQFKVKLKSRLLETAGAIMDSYASMERVGQELHIKLHIKEK